MTSSAGALKTKRGRGFTLIEMIVLIIIMAVLSGVVVPSYMRMLAKSRFQQTVQEVVGLFGWARAAAIESNSEAVLRFDHQSGTLAVMVVTPDLTGDLPVALQETERAAVQPIPRTVVLGEDVTIAEFRVDEVRSSANGRRGVEQIRFHEDGSSDEARIALVSAEGMGIFLHVLPMTGRTVVSDEPE
jgi:prepilin-type N-terminal cleavage/methylation domain-containing protein